MQDVKEATEAELDARDAQEDRIKELTAKVKELEATTEGGGEVLGKQDNLVLPKLDEVSNVTPAPEDLLRQQQEAEIDDKPTLPPPATVKPGLAPAREPKRPDVVIEPGQQLDGMGSRDKRDQGRVAKDLRPEPDVDEEKEVPFEKETGRDSKGKPTVKGK